MIDGVVPVSCRRAPGRNARDGMQTLNEMYGSAKAGRMAGSRTFCDPRSFSGKKMQSKIPT